MSAERNDVQTSVEKRVYLEDFGDVDPELMRCFNATEEDMAFGLDGRKSRSDLAPEEVATVKRYCGPCSQQEACLANAAMSRNVAKLVVGGLNSRARLELRKHYDGEDKTIPKAVWDIAIEAVLQCEAPYFPGQKGAPPKAPVRRKIVETLMSRPTRGIALSEGARVYEVLAEEVDADEMLVRKLVKDLIGEKVVEADVRVGGYTQSISLIA